MFNIIETNKKNKLKTAIIITDLEKAFSKIKTEKMINKLMDLKIVKRIINQIKLNLQNKTLIPNNNENTKNVFHTHEGLAQGRVLSPTLFNIYTKDLHNITNRNITLLQYADDIILIITRKNLKKLEQLGNTAIMELYIMK